MTPDYHGDKLKNKDLVTVYITNYNYGRYIDQCIKSILNQTYKNIELIITKLLSTDKDEIQLVFDNHKDNLLTSNQRNYYVILRKFGE